MIIDKSYSFIGIGKFQKYLIISLIATYNLKCILLLISMMGFYSTLNCLYIYTPEIIPTKIRSTVCGKLYFCGMISPSFVPIIKSIFYNFFGFFFCFFWVCLFIFLLFIKRNS